MTHDGELKLNGLGKALQPVLQLIYARGVRKGEIPTKVKRALEA